MAEKKERGGRAGFEDEEEETFLDATTEGERATSPAPESSHLLRGTNRNGDRGGGKEEVVPRSRIYIPIHGSNNNGNYTDRGSVIIGLRGANRSRVYSEGWRLSKSSVSSIYHSAQDIADLMSENFSDVSEPASPFRSYHSIQGSFFETDRSDIFSSPQGSMNLHQNSKKVCIYFSLLMHLQIHKYTRLLFLRKTKYYYNLNR